MRSDEPARSDLSGRLQGRDLQEALRLRGSVRFARSTLGSVGFGSVSGGGLGVSRRFDGGALDLEHVIDGLAFFELGVDLKLEVPISAGSFMFH